jgi:hypothetical protein
MDESCFRDVLDFSSQNVNYCRNLRTNLDNPSMRQRFLGYAETETRDVSTAPTSDFVDNTVQDLPSVDDYIDD